MGKPFDAAASPFSGARLLSEVRLDYTAGELQRLEARLQFVADGWTTAGQGADARTGLGRPRDGRPEPYPGIPSLFHPDPNNVAHCGWSLMMHSLLYQQQLALSAVAGSVDRSAWTLRQLLVGDIWGMPETRLAPTWGLWRAVLASRSYSLPGLLAVLEQNGVSWLPPGVHLPVWRLTPQGFATPHPTAEMLELRRTMLVRPLIYPPARPRG